MNVFARFRKPKEAKEVAIVRLQAAPDVRGLPGARIHHEYIADDAPVNGRFNWQARVYDADGTMHHMTGSEESRIDACRSALAWAESKKNELRRIA